MDNDIVIVGSDGVFDNLWDEDIIGCIKPAVTGTNLAH